MNIIPRGSLIILEASGISESFQEHVSNSTGCTIITLDPVEAERFVGFVPPEMTPFLIHPDDHSGANIGCECGGEFERVKIDNHHHIISNAEVNDLTLTHLGKYPSFDAQWWAGNVVDMVLNHLVKTKGLQFGVEQPEDPVVAATNAEYADMITALRPFATINEFSVTGSRVFIDGVYRNVNAKTLFIETLSRRVKIISQMDDGSRFSIVGELIERDDLAKTIKELKPSDAAPWSCDVVHAVLSSPVAITEAKRAQMIQLRDHVAEMMNVHNVKQLDNNRVEIVGVPKEPHKYFIGDETMKRVFEPEGMTNLSNMQRFLDAVEKAFTEQAHHASADEHRRAAGLHLTAQKLLRVFVECPENSSARSVLLEEYEEAARAAQVVTDNTGLVTVSRSTEIDWHVIDWHERIIRRHNAIHKDLTQC